MKFFDSYMGMFIAQSVLHSLIAAIIVDRAIQIWGIGDPLVKQRFCLIVILFPIFSFHGYQMINPERGAISFRLNAIFDINRWLKLEFWNIPLGLLFILILSGTTLIFFFQEMIPILRHTFESKEHAFHEKKADDYPPISDALRGLSVEKPETFIIEDRDRILFSIMGERPAIFLSTGLVEILNSEEIVTAIAHEIAHIRRNKRPILVIVFILRVLMFFNPVVLLEFRRAVQEEEKICDDMAVSLTQKPHVLAETLRKLYYEVKDFNPLKNGNLSNLKDSLEEYSHNIHIMNRIIRLEQGSVSGNGGEWMKFILTLAVIVVINYFVV
ncbi:MAG: M48 family metalloprotease [Nitrospirae bacterium]|nr:M48 family metalloprotease [Nitrospirota bacterium]